MQRIAGANTVLIAPGKNGFQDQNTAAGIAGTQVTAAFMTSVQEELCAIVEGTGGTLNAAVNNQVLGALIAMLAPAPIYLTTPGGGTITAPAWATRVLVRAWGAGNQGGGGGPSAANGNGGGGGGAGGYLEGVIGGITGGANYNWQVGNGGGLAGPSSPDTSLSDAASVVMVACNGGGAGTAGTSTAVGIGGGGGTAVGPPAGHGYGFAGFSRAGMGGVNGAFYGQGGGGTGGPGGGAYGGSMTWLTVADSFPGNGFGCGGTGGAVGGYAGGAGAPGALILAWLP